MDVSLIYDMENSTFVKYKVVKDIYIVKPCKKFQHIEHAQQTEQVLAPP